MVFVTVMLRRFRGDCCVCLVLRGAHGLRSENVLHTSRTRSSLTALPAVDGEAHQRVRRPANVFRHVPSSALPCFGSIFFGVGRMVINGRGCPERHLHGCRLVCCGASWSVVVLVGMRRHEGTFLMENASTHGFMSLGIPPTQHAFILITQSWQHTISISALCEML